MYRCESQTSETNNCSECRRRSTCCLRTILSVLSAIFLFVVGIIIGALFSETILGALAAVIVLAAVLLIMTLITAYFLCCRKRSS